MGYLWKYCPLLLFPYSHRGHEGVENTDSKGGAACEWLGEVELSVGVIVIILDQSEVSITVT